MSLTAQKKILSVWKSLLLVGLVFNRQKPCPFDLGLRKFALDFVIVFFFKNAKKNTSGGLIMSLEKCGLI